MNGRPAAVLAVAGLALLGMAVPATAQALFCIVAVDILPPPVDMTNPLAEIRVIQMSVGDSSTSRSD